MMSNGSCHMTRLLLLRFHPLLSSIWKGKIVTWLYVLGGYFRGGRDSGQLRHLSMDQCGPAPLSGEAARNFHPEFTNNDQSKHLNNVLTYYVESYLKRYTVHPIVVLISSNTENYCCCLAIVRTVSLRFLRFSG
jgi:hypothetical protein